MVSFGQKQIHFSNTSYTWNRCEIFKVTRLYVVMCSPVIGRRVQLRSVFGVTVPCNQTKATRKFMDCLILRTFQPPKPSMWPAARCWNCEMSTTMWDCIRTTYAMGPDRVNSRWRAPNKKRMSTVTGPFGWSDQKNSVVGKCPCSIPPTPNWCKKKTWKTIYIFANLAETSSNVAIRFGFSTWQRARTCIRITSKVLCLGIRKSHATVKMVKQLKFALRNR